MKPRSVKAHLQTRIASLKFIYVAPIWLRIDYGSVVYGSAAKTVLSDLDVIQTCALRICLGAVKTAPLCALQVEAAEKPLWLCRKHLMAKYWIHLREHKDSHHTKMVLEIYWEREKVQKKASFRW